MLMYTGYPVPHEVLPGDSTRAATTCSKFSDIYDLGISVVKAYLAGSAILGNLSPVGLGIGNREWRSGLLLMVQVPLWRLMWGVECGVDFRSLTLMQLVYLLLCYWSERDDMDECCTKFHQAVLIWNCNSATRTERMQIKDLNKGVFKRGEVPPLS